MSCQERVWTTATKRLLQAVVVLLVVLPLVAQARPRTGQTAPTVATWDTRASSLGGSYLEGLYNGGHLRFASYYTAFTSTTGRLSSQFGLHYLGYGEAATTAHGLAGTATTMYQVPLTGRQPGGLPWVAVAPYAGVSPSGMVSKDFAAVILPLHAGVGLPVSPLPWLTLTPWAEVSYGLSVSLEVDRETVDKLDSGELKPEDFDPQDLVRFQYNPALSWRFGLNTAVHLGKKLDLQLHATASELSDPKEQRLIVLAGATLLWHWDDVVPAILPNRGCPLPHLVTETGGM